jgi:hypothetical protein
MTHGNLGLMTLDWLWLPGDILQALSIVDDTTVTAFYYPTPNDDEHVKCEPRYDEKHPERARQADIMLTPIPREMWKNVGRFVIRLLHEPGSLHQIAEFLADEDVSILNAECTRSGHRYATWNMLAWIEDPSKLLAKCKTLREPNPLRDKSTDDLIRSLEYLAHEIGEHYGNCLFRGINFTEPKPPVEHYPNNNDDCSPLSYFSNLAAARDEMVRKPNGDPYHINDFEPFTMHCRNGVLKSDEAKLKAILGHMGEDLSTTNLETCVIAEVDTKSYIIRVAIIPSKNLDSHIQVRVPYRRDVHTTSSAGFLKFMTMGLAPKQNPAKYNLWRVYNHTSVHSPEFEEGELVMFAEDKSLREGKKSHDEVVQDAKKFFEEEAKKLSEHLKHIHVSKPIIEPVKEVVRRKKIAERTTAGDYRFDVFISYAFADTFVAKDIFRRLEEVGLLPFMSEKTIEGGDIFSSEIRDALMDSRELCLLYTHSSQKSEWVTTEWGGAWLHGKHIVPFLMHDSDLKLPPRLQERAYYKYPQDLDAYIKEVDRRRRERKRDL